MKVSWILTCLNLVACENVSSEAFRAESIRDMIKVAVDNGWNSVQFLTRNVSSDFRIKFKWIKTSNVMKANIRTCFNVDDVDDTESYRIIVGDFNFDEEFLSQLESRMRQRTLLWRKEPLKRADVTKLKHNAYFYVTSFQDAALSVQSVINTRRFTHPIINAVNFNPGGGFTFAETNLNFQGELFSSVSLSFKPYLTITEDEDDDDEHAGAVFDMVRVIAESNNLTLVSEKEPNGRWGLIPHENGTYTGVYGAVVSDNCDTSISTWSWNTERDPLVDFSPMFNGPFTLALTPQSLKIEYNFFLRPFTSDAWVMISITVIAIAALSLAPYFKIKAYEHMDSHFVVCTTGWFFFTLINAFYSGALTMFFTMDFQLPFETMTEVLEAYPNWKLRVLNGNEVIFYNLALHRGKLYQEFFERVQTDSEDAVYYSLEDGLKYMRESSTVIHVNTGMLNSIYKEHKEVTQEIKKFGDLGINFQSIIFPKNSPFLPIFRKAFLKMREGGTTSLILNTWEGAGIPNSNVQSKEKLSAGQAILVYLVICGATALSSIILLGEIVIKYSSLKRGTTILFPML